MRARYRYSQRRHPGTRITRLTGKLRDSSSIRIACRQLSTQAVAAQGVSGTPVVLASPVFWCRPSALREAGTLLRGLPLTNNHPVKTRDMEHAPSTAPQEAPREAGRPSPGVPRRSRSWPRAASWRAWSVWALTAATSVAVSLYDHTHRMPAGLSNEGTQRTWVAGVAFHRGLLHHRRVACGNVR
jgi:hypothetical protein